jgi:hypothetical protein
MTVTLKEIMAQMPKERQQKIRKRVDELIAEEKAINDDVNSISNLKDRPKSNQEESLIREFRE